MQTNRPSSPIGEVVTRPGKWLLGFYSEPDVRSIIAGLHTPEEQERILNDWRAAQAVLAVAVSPAGPPSIEELDAGYSVQLATVAERLAVGADNLPYRLVRVEIDKLIAFQPNVDLQYSAELVEQLRGDAESFVPERLCLPLEPRKQPLFVEIANGEISMTVYSTGPNLRPLGMQFIPNESGPSRVAFDIGLGSPFVAVAHFQGRYFLKNGYHRLHALREAGHVFAPALLVDCATPDQIGAIGPGFFPPQMLFGMRPPVMGDFFSGAAVSVRIREVTRILRLRCDSFCVSKPVSPQRPAVPERGADGNASSKVKLRSLSAAKKARRRRS